MKPEVPRMRRFFFCLQKSSCICRCICRQRNLTHFTLCFILWRPLAVHPCTAYFFCKNSWRNSARKATGSARPLAAAKKSDKNLRPTENLVYYIQEMRKEKFPQYIRRIRRRVRSFLCFRNPRCLCRQRGFCILLPVKSGILYV